MAALRILKGPSPGPGSSDEGDGDFDARLRKVENAVSRIEAHLEHMATRAWILGGVLGGMGVAAGVAVGIAQIISK